VHTLDLGLLVLRAVTGLVLVAHGSQKLFGWFGGFGPRGTATYLAGLGFRSGLLFALLAGLAESGGGLLLALGLLTPLAVTAVVGAMLVVAVAGHAAHGFWSHNGGFELPLLYGVIGAAIGVAGPGAFALDTVLGLSLSGLVWGGAAAALGVLGGTLALATRCPSARAAGASA